MLRILIVGGYGIFGGRIDRTGGVEQQLAVLRPAVVARIGGKSRYGA